jgi:acyl carrier protein
MPNKYWHTGIDPKVQGTWNLHNAIRGRGEDLDFFIMSSSVSGTVGTATESNYCAANYFLDAFARYRRRLGLPALSLGLGMISEVGYLHENPEIEALLLRKGIQAINEDELLQIFDIAMNSTKKDESLYDELANAHVLTGLEPHGLKELKKKGFEGTSPTLNDPRCSLLAGAFEDDHSSLNGTKGNFSAELEAALEGQSGRSFMEVVSELIIKRFSNLILVPLEKVDVNKPLAEYGMDSMIAAEFRTWFFNTFKVDIPFLELLSKTVTLQSVANTVVNELSQ